MRCALRAVAFFRQTPPLPTRPVVPTARRTNDQDLAAGAATAAPRPEGIGSIHAWATEVQHNLPSAGRNRTGAQADAVLQATEDGVPVLIVEVDNGTESPGVLVAKFAKYLRFFQLRTKDSEGREYPVWRTMYAATDREGHPPIAVVFNGRMSTDALHARMQQVKELSGEYWQGRYHAPFDFYGKPATDGYWDHSAAIPIIVTTLQQLTQHGPHAPIWWRYGRSAWEPILTALANPDDQAAYRLREQERRRQGEERDRRHHAELDRQIQQDAVRERRRKKEKKRMKALIALWNEAAGALGEDAGDRQDRYDAEYQ